MAFKDLNGNQSVDVGDWVAAWVDASGNLQTISTTTSGADLALQVVPPAQATTPAELVGTWMIPGSRGWTIRADATYDWVSLYVATTCYAVDRVEITQDGVLAVQGNTITFTVLHSTAKSTDCSGTVTTTLSSGAVRSYTWRVAPGTYGGTSLYLTNLASNPPMEEEFRKE